MRKHKYSVLLASAMAVVSILSTSVCAQEVKVDPTTQFCFSAEDFIGTESADGLFLTAVPKSTVAAVKQGSRILKAGDALPTDSLDQLALECRCVTPQSAAISYYTVTDGIVSGVKELKLSILPKKNEAPVAEDGMLETYRNIPNSGTLPATDPEDDLLVYAVETAPKRGTVEIHEDGSYTYTPNENKVGKDSFTYTVTDEAGQTSEPGKITIEIKKPTDQRTYADMDGDPDVFNAMWLKEEDLFTGSSVGGHLCFEPDRAMTRGEFLVMVMNLVDAQADSSQMTSGFADEAETPAWQRPYVVSAFGNGMITGTLSDAGILFRPTDRLTHAEAAVILQNTLQLPVSDVQQVSAFDEDPMVPTWAENAAAALSAAGIDLNLTGHESIVTRRDAASLFYQVNRLLATQENKAFYWKQQ